MTGAPGNSTRLDAVRQWPSEPAKRWAHWFLEHADRDEDVRVVVGIGSAFRDVDSAADIDLLVAYLQEPAPFGPVPIDVDVRLVPVDRLRTLALQGDHLVGWGLTYGVLLLDKDGDWQRLLEELDQQVPLPDRSGALEHARRAKRLHTELLDLGDEEAAREQLLVVLTHIARAMLVDAGIYPPSRPELPSQLRGIGEDTLARALEDTMRAQKSPRDVLASLSLSSLQLLERV